MWIDNFVKISCLLRRNKTKSAIIVENTRLNFVLRSRNSMANLNKEVFLEPRKMLKVGFSRKETTK